MNKVYINKKTNMVEQILNIDEDPRWSPDWFPTCYVVDDPNNEISTYNLRYDRLTKKYEVVEGVEPIPTAVTLPSEMDLIKGELRELEKLSIANKDNLLSTIDDILSNKISKEKTALEDENKMLKQKISSMEEKLDKILSLL